MNLNMFLDFSLSIYLGFSCPATVIYVSETTSPSLRGTLGCVPALQMALGNLFCAKLRKKVA